jgi:hypothetical protein
MSIRISKGGRLFGIVAALGGAVMIGGAALTWTKAVRVTYFLPYEISELNGADRIATLVLDVRQRALLTPKTPTQPRNSTRSAWPGSLSDRRIPQPGGGFLASWPGRSTGSRTHVPDRDRSRASRTGGKVILVLAAIAIVVALAIAVGEPIR